MTFDVSMMCNDVHVRIEDKGRFSCYLPGIQLILICLKHILFSSLLSPPLNLLFHAYLCFRVPNMFSAEEELSIEVADINGIQVDLYIGCYWCRREDVELGIEEGLNNRVY